MSPALKNTETGLACDSWFTYCLSLFHAVVGKTTTDWGSQIQHSAPSSTFMLLLPVKYFHSIPVVPKVLRPPRKISEVQVPSKYHLN